MPPGSTTGNQALFMVEKFSAQPLANFGTLKWSTARTYAVWNSSTFKYLTSEPYLAWEMSNDNIFYPPPCITSTHILSYPVGATAGGKFSEIWCRGS